MEIDGGDFPQCRMGAADLNREHGESRVNDGCTVSEMASVVSTGTLSLFSCNNKGKTAREGTVHSNQWQY